MIAYAQTYNIETGYVDSILEALNNWVGALIPLLIAIAVIVFFWGVIQYIRAGAEDKAKAINLMIMSVVGIAVMVSIWGLVALLQNVFGVTGGELQTTQIPDVPTTNP